MLTCLGATDRPALVVSAYAAHSSLRRARRSCHRERLRADEPDQAAARAGAMLTCLGATDLPALVVSAYAAHSSLRRARRSCHRERLRADEPDQAAARAGAMLTSAMRLMASKAAVL